MTQYAFYFDNTRCTGCKTCELACKDYKNLSKDISFRKVYDYEGGTWNPCGSSAFECSSFVYHVSMSCNHCDNPACVSVCPTGAMHKDAQSGLVSVNEGRCIGCGYCHMACPYNSPKVDRQLGHSVKCDGCAARVSEGKAPICVEACPLRALEFGPVEEMQKLGERGRIAPLPNPKYTHPNIYIKEAQDARLYSSDEGSVVNVKEVL